MKMKWSVILSLALMLLAGCGKEEFGSTAQNNTQSASPLTNYKQVSCSSFTLIKPKVDILYVVDNSTSNYYVADDIKTAVKNTVATISQQFDYRVIGTNLLPLDETPFDDYQVMTNSQDPLSSEASSRVVISSSQLNFFSNRKDGAEAGLRRVIEFVNYNTGISPSLFRQNAYLVIVLVSNGRDTEVEGQSSFNNSTFEKTDGNGVSIYSHRLNSMKYIKDTLLHSQQLRFFSVTADTSCNSGWLSSALSYSRMSRDIYSYSEATDSPGSRDHFDLCSGGISKVFTAINSSIKQVVIPHRYKYWPITFTDSDDIDVSKIKVFKSTPNSAPVQVTTGWQYLRNPGTVNTRVFPLPEGEPTDAKHLIEFTAGNEVEYPACISVTSTSKTEYFGYIVLPQAPTVDSLVVRINGKTIPKSNTNGWSYIGNAYRNIKMEYPAAGDQNPGVYKSGFMIQLNGSANYYKSGDSVEVNFAAAPI